jgi:hypothetical protein
LGQDKAPPDKTPLGKFVWGSLSEQNTFGEVCPGEVCHVGKFVTITSASRKEISNMGSILIKDTTREERIRIVHQALWGSCGIDCEFCSGCDNRGGGRTESIYQPYIDGIKEIREINEEFRAPLVRG